MKLDLDELERKVRESEDEELPLSHRQALALIARIRELEVLAVEAADAMEASAADHSQCDDHTDDLQFKAAQRWRTTLSKGAVLDYNAGVYQPTIGDAVEAANVARRDQSGTVVRNQGGRLPWIVRWPDGCETGYAAHEIRPAQ